MYSGTERILNDMNTGIIAAVASGIVLGLFLFPEQLVQYIGIVIDMGLCALLFFVGIDIGRNKDIINQIKACGFRMLLVPMMIALGSITGSMAGGFLIGLPFNESGAVGAGLGWYSLSAIILSDYSAEIGAVAFITNVCRELFALMAIPFIARYIGKLESIAPAGATAMDTSLPVVSRATDSRTAVVSFISGVVLSLLVPVLVPLMIAL
ncbi:MAG TPA: lysine exporter LysO family protein [Clostridia bacterium]|nr:lysine exporter LysO family protein [Clostridia bacterium]